MPANAWCLSISQKSKAPLKINTAVVAKTNFEW